MASGIWSGKEIISDDGNVIVVRFFDTDTLTPGQAYPTGYITYEQSTISSRRTKDEATNNDALSPDKITGVAAGF
ncbi:MAG TPA: hypothetical protein ENN91_05825 [Firmicutes bacterium]|nr:hypothetical protein [Bacillota bacterium]